MSIKHTFENALIEWADRSIMNIKSFPENADIYASYGQGRPGLLLTLEAVNLAFSRTLNWDINEELSKCIRTSSPFLRHPGSYFGIAGMDYVSKQAGSPNVKTSKTLDEMLYKYANELEKHKGQLTLKHCDVLFGAAGIIIASTDTREEIRLSTVQILKSVLVNYLEDYFDKSNPEGRFDYGFAHGVTGIFYSLICSGITHEQLPRFFPIYMQHLAHGYENFGHAPEFFYVRDQKWIPSVRSAWCYGDLGIALVVEELKNIGHEIFQFDPRSAWRRQEYLNFEGISLCHGIAGLWICDSSTRNQILVKVTDLIKSSPTFTSTEQSDISVLEGMSGFILAYLLTEYDINFLHPFGKLNKMVNYIA